jgi:hypothetical protein
MLAQTCMGFHVECGNLVKGSLGVLTGFVLFIGSVLLLVSAVFGRKLGYLIVAVSFFAWMILFSALWTFGFFSQGPKTPVDLGPRGREPGWVIEAAGQNVTNLKYPQYGSYPLGDAWKTPTPARTSRCRTSGSRRQGTSRWPGPRPTTTGAAR